ncbi:hypothetical protein [Xylella phage Bacata]|nr:hypothetical protein JT315_gp50 [Xylella phage Bacata]CAA2367828.1 hypothetical protein [Xylella phage Bacata]
MSHHIEKQFRNTATTPMIVSVAACVDEQGIVREIHATGGVVGTSDDQRAEAQRMHKWIRETFIGQHSFFFNAHDGTVFSAEKPHRREYPFSKQPEIHIINTIDFSPDAIADAMKGTPSLIERIMRRDFSKTQTTKGAASDRKEARAVTVGHPGYEFAPKVGTYWQDRNRPARFFMVVSTHECEGHSHVRMLRVDNGRGGEYEWIFTTASAWNDLFAPTTAGAVPGNPYAQMAAELHDVSFKPARSRRVGMPPELGMGYGLIESLFRDFIENVEFDGTEQPPAAGERYFSVISGGTYTVIDARRKPDSTDYYVTMERDGDGHRTKFTYRDHATWLATWRPADDEGEAREVVEVELRLDTKDASEALRNVGEQAHAAAEAMMDFREANAERQLNVIYRELDRKVPGWRNMGAHYENIDDVGLALRAIRSINKHMRNYQQIAETSTNEVAKLSDKNRELSSLLGVRTREVDKLKQERGGAWDAARVRREQDTMREMIRHYALLFARHHGKAALKEALASLDADTLLGLPHEHFMLLVTKCEAHSAREEV